MVNTFTTFTSPSVTQVSMDKSTMSIFILMMEKELNFYQALELKEFMDKTSYNTDKNSNISLTDYSKRLMSHQPHLILLLAQCSTADKQFTELLTLN